VPFKPENDVPFFTKGYHFLTKGYHFLTKVYHFLTKAYHFLTKGYHFLTKIDTFPEDIFVFLMMKNNFAKRAERLVWDTYS
jgi:hypothetical protein